MSRGSEKACWVSGHLQSRLLLWSCVPMKGVPYNHLCPSSWAWRSGAQPESTPVYHVECLSSEVGVAWVHSGWHSSHRLLCSVNSSAVCMNLSPHKSRRPPQPASLFWVVWALSMVEATASVSWKGPTSSWHLWGIRHASPHSLSA